MELIIQDETKERINKFRRLVIEEDFRGRECEPLTWDRMKDADLVKAAFFEGELAGFALLQTDPTRAELSVLFVRRKFRKNGIGSKLCLSAVDAFDTLEIDRIRCDVTTPSMLALLKTLPEHLQSRIAMRVPEQFGDNIQSCEEELNAPQDEDQPDE